MASFEQKIAAELVRERGKKLLKADKSGKTPKELEAERLYFWILSRIAHEIETSMLMKKSFKLTITEKYLLAEKNEIILCDDKMAEYHFMHVFGDDINDVLIRVKCSLSSMDGYNSYVMQPHNDKQKAILIVTVEL